MTDSLRRLISRRLSPWQKLVAFAPSLLLTVALPSETLLRCRMDGLLRSSCCCPADKGPPSPMPVAKAQDCCEREVTVSQRSAAEPGRRVAEDFVAVTIAALAPALTLATDSGANRAVPVPNSHGPPRDGPSLVLLKHAFLI